MKQIFSKIINNYRGCIVIRKDEEKVILKVPSEISGGNDLFVKIYLFPNNWKRFYKGQSGSMKWQDYTESPDFPCLLPLQPLMTELFHHNH